MNALRIAIATCTSLPTWEVDDRPLYDALRRHGADVFVVPWDDPAVIWGAFDACLIRTTWDYQARRDDFVAWAQRAGAETALFNPADVVRWNTDKAYLRRLESAGFPVVPTIWLPQGDPVDIAALVRDAGWKTAFLKPQVGAGARGTLRFSADRDGLAHAQAFADGAVAQEDYLLQPYLSRVETAGELSLIFFDGALSHAVRKVPVPGDYRVQDDHGATDAPLQPDDALVTLCRAVMGWAAGDGPPLLYGRVDLVEDDQGAPRVVEVEVVEPSLFFRHAPTAPGHLADAFLSRVAPLRH